jgi:hypothetical protein
LAWATFWASIFSNSSGHTAGEMGCPFPSWRSTCTQLIRVRKNRGHCYYFKNIFAQKIGEKFGDFHSNYIKLVRHKNISLIVKKSANFLSEKIGEKIITSNPARNP